MNLNEKLGKINEYIVSLKRSREKVMNLFSGSERTIAIVKIDSCLQDLEELRSYFTEVKGVSHEEDYKSKN